MVERKLASVLDLGCGLGMKLEELIYPVCRDIMGIDELATIAECKQLHEFGKWRAITLEDSALDLGRTFDLNYSGGCDRASR
jgi:hypothetical protein